MVDAIDASIFPNGETRTGAWRYAFAWWRKDDLAPSQTSELLLELAISLGAGMHSDAELRQRAVILFGEDKALDLISTIGAGGALWIAPDPRRGWIVSDLVPAEAVD
jgi:hypothetical protein